LNHLVKTAKNAAQSVVVIAGMDVSVGKGVAQDPNKGHALTAGHDITITRGGVPTGEDTCSVVITDITVAIDIAATIDTAAITVIVVTIDTITIIVATVIMVITTPITEVDPRHLLCKTH